MTNEEQLLAKLQESVYLSAVSGSPNIDRFSEWTLAGAGAVFGVIFANLDSTTAHISLCALRWAISFLILSAVFAGLQKIFATGVHSGTEAYQKAMPFIIAIFGLPDLRSFVSRCLSLSGGHFDRLLRVPCAAARLTSSTALKYPSFYFSCRASQISSS
jgi:hypothetical protein